MNELTDKIIFVENGDCHEKSDFSNYIFNNLDYYSWNKEISFYRSDFSRTTINNCKFTKNAFGRSDFINAKITNTTFEKVNFGSCLMKYTYLDNVEFKNNSYSGIALQYSHLHNCYFYNEIITTNMYSCSFHNCVFRNCKFEKASMDKNTFVGCEFFNVDISECTADNLRFDSCHLTNMCLGYGIWSTYLFKNTNFDGINFKKQGDIITKEEAFSQQFFEQLYKNGMYFEYLNCLILSSNETSTEIDLSTTLNNLIPIILKEPEMLRKSNIIRILEMLLFYINSKNISLFNYINIVQSLERYSWDEVSFEEKLQYSSLIYQMSLIINGFNYDLEYIFTVPRDKKIISTWHINVDNKEDAIEELSNVFLIANKELGDNKFPEPLFEVLQCEKGSIILTVAGWAMLVLFISYVAVQIVHNISVCITTTIATKKIVDKINKSKTNKQISETLEVAKNYDLIVTEKNMKNISKLSRKLTASKIANIFLSLFK